MASGVAITQEVVETYQEIKANHMHKYVVFKLNDKNTEIVVDEKAPKTGGSEMDVWSQFCSSLPPNDPRYIFYDLQYSQTREGAGESTSDKVIFINWCPDNAPIKKKMISASSKDALKKKLDQGIKEIQANDISDLDMEDVKRKVMQK